MANVLTPIFGKTFIERQDAPILVIGRKTPKAGQAGRPGQSWNREQLAAIGITNIGACRAVTEIAAVIEAKSVRDLYAKFDVGSLARTRGKGLTVLFVLWKLFESEGLDSASWYAKGREGAIRTFTTIKRKEFLHSLPKTA